MASRSTISRSVTIWFFIFIFAWVIVANNTKDSKKKTPNVGLKWAPFLPGSKLHGIHGIAFDPKDRMFVGSVLGQSVFQVKITERGVDLSPFIPSPTGMADDLDFNSEGTLAFTSFLTGEMMIKKRGEEVTEIGTRIKRNEATGEVEIPRKLLGLNSVGWDSKNRLFASQVFLGDALWEFDVNDVTPPRLISDRLGGLAGFDFGDDGWLYGPLLDKHKVVKINVNTGQILDVAYGFETPSAVSFDKSGLLWVLDTATGDVVQLDLKQRDEKKNRKKIARLSPGIDSLAFDQQGSLYVTNLALNGIYHVNPKTGEVMTVIESLLSVPSGIHLLEDEEGVEHLFIADFYAFRSINTQKMEVETLGVQFEKGVNLEHPTSIFASQKHIVLSSLYTGIVQVRKRNGKLVSQVKGLASPCGVAELDNGSVLVAEFSSGSILQLYGNNFVLKRVIDNDLHGPVGIAVSACNSYFYVTEYLAGKLTRIEIETGTKMLIASGLNKPEGITLTHKGEVLVAEVGNRRLLSFHPQKGTRKVLAENLPIGLTAPEGFSPPFILTEIAISSSTGIIYMSSDVHNTILKFDPIRNQILKDEL